ncbi:MAG: hypothetical protein D3923_02220, partial [Candidatus Electrothrix sp. AR3]|nr:hypothetical protein [Candidatus Electrothrix sp. AR3]
MYFTPLPKTKTKRSNLMKKIKSKIMGYWLAIILVILMTSNVQAADPSINLTALTAAIGTTNDLKIWFYFDLQNNGTSSVDRNRISIKYWFTFEQGHNVYLNYTSATDSAVNFTQVTNRNGVDMVAEITFNNSSNIEPGGNVGKFEMQYVDDWWSAKQDENNDYSFRSSDPTTLSPNNKVTVYYDGVLVYGIEPAPLLCLDGIQNGDETGIDCGGTCPACESTTSCDDGEQNGDETDIDCGGSCPPCESSSSCNDGIQNGDETGVDCGGTCPACPTCNDGIKNGNETGVDCGGSCSAACPTCNDGIQNGDETDIDCGGSC